MLKSLGHEFPHLNIGPLGVITILKAGGFTMAVIPPTIIHLSMTISEILNIVCASFPDFHWSRNPHNNQIH